MVLVPFTRRIRDYYFSGPLSREGRAPAAVSQGRVARGDRRAQTGDFAATAFRNGICSGFSRVNRTGRDHAPRISGALGIGALGARRQAEGRRRTAKVHAVQSPPLGRYAGETEVACSLALLKDLSERPSALSNAPMSAAVPIAAAAKLAWREAWNCPWLSPD